MSLPQLSNGYGRCPVLLSSAAKRQHCVAVQDSCCTVAYCAKLAQSCCLLVCQERLKHVTPGQAVQSVQLLLLAERHLQGVESE